MAKKVTSAIKALNAPKKGTWLISLLVAIVGLILWLVGLIAKVNVITVIGPVLLIVSSGLMLLGCSIKGL